VGAHRNDQEHDRECPRGLAAIARDFPPWHTWEGVFAGLLYARRPNYSPPIQPTRVPGQSWPLPRMTLVMSAWRRRHLSP
jgi:hypothetical protein